MVRLEGTRTLKLARLRRKQEINSDEGNLHTDFRTKDMNSPVHTVDDFPLRNASPASNRQAAGWAPGQPGRDGKGEPLHSSVTVLQYSVLLPTEASRLALLESSEKPESRVTKRYLTAKWRIEK